MSRHYLVLLALYYVLFVVCGCSDINREVCQGLVLAAEAERQLVGTQLQVGVQNASCLIGAYEPSPQLILFESLKLCLMPDRRFILQRQRDIPSEDTVLTGEWVTTNGIVCLWPQKTCVFSRCAPQYLLVVGASSKGMDFDHVLVPLDKTSPYWDLCWGINKGKRSVNEIESAIRYYGLRKVKKTELRSDLRILQLK
jgi:hypothetical protein